MDLRLDQSRSAGAGAAPVVAAQADVGVIVRVVSSLCSSTGEPSPGCRPGQGWYGRQAVAHAAGPPSPHP